MTDYLQPVGDGFRRMAALVCLPAALVAAALFGLVTASMVEEGQLDRNGKPLWVAAVVLGLIAVACGWLCIRLWAGRSANGVTILPVWFIEVFGILFLAGGVWVGISSGFPGGGGTGIGVALAMVLIRQAVRRRAPGSLAPEEGAPGEPSASSARPQDGR